MKPRAATILIALCAITLAVLAAYSTLTATKNIAPASPAHQRTLADARIVSLSPAITVILNDLSYGSAIVGRHQFDPIAPQSLPICGDQSGLNYEALIAAKPTHIFTQWGMRDLPPRLTELATQYGWAVIDCRLLSLRDVSQATSDLDLEVQRWLSPPPVATVQPPHSPAAARILSEMASRWPPTPSPTPATTPSSKPVRTLALLSTEPFAAAGPGSFHYELAERAGGTMVNANGPAFQTMSREDLLRLAPDVVLIYVPVGGDAGDATTAEQRVRTVYTSVGRPTPARIVHESGPDVLLPGTNLLALFDRAREVIQSAQTK